MPIELEVAIITVMSILSFCVGRQTSAKNAGREWGSMKTNIEHIMADIKELKLAINAMVNKEEQTRMEADKSLHARIDEHLALFHAAGNTANK